MRQRQQKIVEYIEKTGIASLEDLAKMFGVSTFTIRRDIDYLSQARLLVRIKGGARRIETPSHFRETSLPSRMQINLAAKEKIALKALEFIHPGDNIFLDGSSTITCLARTMAQSCRHITVLTNSILVALELSEASDIRLVGLGGVFDKETFSFVGFDSDYPTDAFHVDKAFFSCAGFVPGEGTFENAAFNRNTKRLVARHADKVYLLIDSSKFAQRALNMVLNTSQIDVIVTEKKLAADMAETIYETNKNLQIITAEGK